MMSSLEQSSKAGSVGKQKVCRVLTLRNSEDVEDLQERMRSIEHTVGEQQRRLQKLSRSTTGAGTETWRIRSCERCACAQLLPCNSVHVPKPSRRQRAVRVCMDVWLPELKGGSHMSASYAYGLERLRHRMPRARLQVQDEQLQSVHGFAQQLQMMHKGPTARRRPNSVEKHSPNRLLGHTTYSRKTTLSIVAEELVDIFRDPFLIGGIPLYLKSKLD